MVPLEQGMVMLTSLAAIDEDGSVRPETIPAQLDLYSLGRGVRMPGRLMFAATMAIQIPLVEGTEFAALDASTLSAPPIGRRRSEEQALQDLLDASPSALGIDNSVNWREFDTRSLANTEAETEIINLTLESLPVSEDLDGFVPPHRPEDRTTFDWDIDSTIRPSRGHNTREEAWPEKPYVASAAAVLRWLHSAQLGALCATIHCAGGHTQVRAFECNLLDEQGRPSGLDRPESLVDMLYKFESVRARDGHPLPRTPLTPFPEPFSLRSGEIVDAPATGINRPRRSERYSLNYNWSQISENFEDVARPVLEHWSKKDEDFRPRED
ncbi:hypothetical protein FOL47_002082 [Perkinsus chesapeaki]|uniref:Uncharacterized protein n=1 Tax=Perkinsus chesapeaki TaxID=330153 RepID=A0A7J6KQW6_PERCH|nr:hypothetical protein FOL47_002082 [Perkinsus chesapeaki]